MAPKSVSQPTPPAWLGAGASFLDQLDAADRSALMALGAPLRFRRGAFIFKSGREGDMVYVVESGRVKVAQHSVGGREMILWFCLPGEVFGLAASPRVGPRLVDAQACTETTVRCIPSGKFHTFLRTHPRVSVELVNLLLCRLYVLCDGLLNLTSESAEGRLASLLIHLRYRYGRPVGDEVCIELALTQQEIADMIGASRQTVSGLLNQMKQKGEIRVAGRRLFLPL
jgi:CRP/FNR family transcriptional regulator, cyclic AMP receptor protein